MLEPKVFYRKLTGVVWIKKNFVKLCSSPLTCDPALFPDKNSPNIAKSNRIFPGKGRGDKALILTYLDSPAADVFQH